ncbi:MAG TPA: hypothetical protein VKO20_04770, partial [Desulfosalsimonadaceae bacterium]|nr:hypothetical protein [Desulfosalsimonadaceae bacterium]
MTPKDNDPIENLRNKLRALFGFSDQKNKTAPPGGTRFNIWYLMLAIFLFSYLQQFMFSSKPETIAYSQFKQYVDQ